MISSMSSAAWIACRTLRLSVGGAEKFGIAIWTQKFCSGLRTMFGLVLSRSCDLVGTSSTAWNSPVSRPATRAPGSTTKRTITVSTQATL